ncbi:MAG TPA: DoxX family protein [Gemmatimonadales bacterium]|nr:DoxX family protein [Gemmatimonadales bacterium]
MTEALLLARLFVGLGLASHGAQKLFGWFGGGGIAGTAGWLEGMGFRPARVYALGAGLGEFGGGMLTALGFLGPVGGAAMIVVMLVAVLVVHRQNGFFNGKNGMELPLLYATGGFIFAYLGFGPYSLDHALRFHLFAGARRATAVILVGVIVALACVAARRPSPQKN